MNPLPSQKTCAELLKINVEATPTEVMAAFLKQLSDEDMVPDFGVVVAVNRLANKTLPQNESDLYFLRGQFNKDLAEFKENFWTLAPPERKQHWELLVATYPQPWAIRELARLKPGLDDTPKKLANDEENAIVEVCKELFLLTPRQQIARRRKWLYEQIDKIIKQEGVRFSASKRIRLRIVSKKVEIEYPMLMRLAPELFNMIHNDVLHATKIIEEPLPSMKPPEWMDVIVKNKRESNPQPADYELQKPVADFEFEVGKPEHLEYSSNNTSRKSTSWILPLIFFGIIAIFRVANSDFNPTKPPSKFNSTNGQVTLPSKHVFNSDSYYTPLELLKIKEYDKNPKGPPPPRYLEWKLKQ